MCGRSRLGTEKDLKESEMLMPLLDGCWTLQAEKCKKRSQRGALADIVLSRIESSEYHRCLLHIKNAKDRRTSTHALLHQRRPLYSI
ncbi:MAG: hypothetical protein CMQ29_15525 [Gammaproteobacteria bacterium]|nr:hypothetical protein [Gammaproteobacteria bacterium]